MRGRCLQRATTTRIQTISLTSCDSVEDNSEESSDSLSMGLMRPTISTKHGIITKDLIVQHLHELVEKHRRHTLKHAAALLRQKLQATTKITSQISTKLRSIGYEHVRRQQPRVVIEQTHNSDHR